MKKLVLILFFVFTAFSLQGQTYKFILTRGKTTDSALWELGKTNDYYTLKVEVDGRTSYHKIDFDGRTKEWRNVIPDEDTDYTVSLKDGVYTIRGKKNGKEFNKTEKAEYPWYQSICFSAPLIMQMQEGSNVKYENVSPRDGKIYPMTATFNGTSTIGKHTVRELKCSSAGVFAGVWNSYYYLDVNTKKFISYNAVEGYPGTPRTRWLLDD